MLVLNNKAIYGAQAHAPHSDRGRQCGEQPRGEYGREGQPRRGQLAASREKAQGSGEEQGADGQEEVIAQVIASDPPDCLGVKQSLQCFWGVLQERQHRWVSLHLSVADLRR